MDIGNRMAKYYFVFLFFFFVLLFFFVYLFVNFSQADIGSF